MNECNMKVVKANKNNQVHGAKIHEMLSIYSNRSKKVRDLDVPSKTAQRPHNVPCFNFALCFYT